MPRLSRQESQQLTRQKLVDAAEKEILKVGIYEASIRSICDGAGYTLGAFYSNFKDKNELLIEVVDRQTEREFHTLKDVVSANASLDEKKVLASLAGWLKRLQKNKILCSLALEFEVYANHNPSFKKTYNINKKKWHDELAKNIELLFKEQGLTPKVPVQQLAVGFSALWSGFIIESDVPGADSADKIIPMFLEALLESAKRTQK